jgi:hypothetical protein
MSELFASPLGSSAEPEVEDDLPGLGALPPRKLIELGLDQIDAAARHLGGFLATAAIRLPTTSDVRSLILDHPGDEAAIRQAILDLHVGTLTKLTAADFRCGKAYGLGRALADTCAPSQPLANLKRHLGRYRSYEMRGWLDDLKSLLPDHTAQAVSDSLGAWIAWADQNPFGSTEDNLRVTSRALHAQGQRWRALLSGEKEAVDGLTLEDYVTVADRALARTSQLARQAARKLIVPLILAAVLLCLGIALVVFFNGAARVVAGLGTIAISLGITWRSAASLLTQLGKRLEEPIWGAECDLVIGDRITRLPVLVDPPTAPPAAGGATLGAVPADASPPIADPSPAGHGAGGPGEQVTGAAPVDEGGTTVELTVPIEVRGEQTGEFGPPFPPPAGKAPDG